MSLGGMYVLKIPSFLVFDRCSLMCCSSIDCLFMVDGVLMPVKVMSFFM